LKGHGTRCLQQISQTLALSGRHHRNFNPRQSPGFSRVARAAAPVGRSLRCYARNSGHRTFRHGQGDGQQITLRLSSNFNLIWRRECPPNPQQVCLYTKHLEIERGACPQIDMQFSSRFCAARAAFHRGDYHTRRARPAPPAAGPSARAAAPLAGEVARVPERHCRDHRARVAGRFFVRLSAIRDSAGIQTPSSVNLHTRNRMMSGALTCTQPNTGPSASG